MDLLGCDLKGPCLEKSLSLTDVKNKLFPKSKLDRAVKLSEERYTPKTLIGNWFERRVVYIPPPDDWRTLYDIDYKVHKNVSWGKNQDLKWDNKLMLEGLPQEIILDHRKQYRSNMTTTYDLCYNILPKGLQGPRYRSYNARKRKWLPEIDLTKSWGTLTKFGLREMMRQEIYDNSLEGLAKCRWKTTYREEIGQLKPIDTEQKARFPKRIVDFNVPNLKLFERKLPNKEDCLFTLNKRK